MCICSPQLALSPEATLGGEVYDREILTRLAGLGVEIELLLPAGLPCPEVRNLRVTRLPLRRGLRWFISNLVFLPYIGRVYWQRPFDLLRVHSLRFTGPAALALCREVDVMFVLGGLHSANTRELARLCRSAGVDAHHLETKGQFDPSMVGGKKVAGVTAGASTPEWIVEEFVDMLEQVET